MIEATLLRHTNHKPSQTYEFRTAKSYYYMTISTICTCTFPVAISSSASKANYSQLHQFCIRDVTLVFLLCTALVVDVKQRAPRALLERVLISEETSVESPQTNSRDRFAEMLCLFNEGFGFTCRRTRVVENIFLYRLCKL